MNIRYSDYQTQKQKQWSLEDFELLHRIGRGKFGEVYAAKEKASDFLVAIKVMSKHELAENNYTEQVKRQVIIQSTLNHPNIIRLYGYFSTPTAFSLILQYATKGELFSILKRVVTFTEMQVSKIIKQVCQGLSYLHASNIIHRDIKPENILVAGETVKIADFGWAIYSQTKRETFCGTLDYLSPQMLQGHSHDSKVDIWALGVLTYELAVGKTPFEDNSRAETANKIVAQTIVFPNNLSSDLKKFVRRCLQKDPSKRPSARTLLQDTFMQKYEDQTFKLQ